MFRVIVLMAGLAAAGLVACAPMVDVVKVSAIPPAELASSQRVRVYVLGQNTPEYDDYLAEVEAYSCKFYPTDPPASRGDALQQLRWKAWKQGADAVINITFDVRGTDAWGTNCWETVKASGSAVKLKK